MPADIREVASLKLALVGLKGLEGFPAQVSGGMQKRARPGARMALDPEVPFFDEPSAGLDPISSKLLDEATGSAVSCEQTSVRASAAAARRVGVDPTHGSPVGHHCGSCNHDSTTAPVFAVTVDS